MRRALATTLLLLWSALSHAQLNQPIFPTPYPNDPGCKKWCELTIHIQGNGVSTPREGLHRLHKYPLDCVAPCAKPPSCEEQTLTVLAKPSDGWQLYAIEVNGERFITPTVSFPALDTVHVEIVFIPAIEPNLDLLGDFFELLLLLKQPEEMYRFDQNGDPPLGAAEAGHYIGNGIPDAAEFALLQAMLQEPGRIDSLKDGSAPDSALIYRAWLHNLDAAKGALAGTSASESIRRILAAYMVVSSGQGRDFGAATIGGLFGAQIDARQFMSLPKGALLPSSDLDGDRKSNLEEWRAFGTGAESLAELNVFVNAVLDPAVVPGRSKSEVIMRFPSGGTSR